MKTVLTLRGMRMVCGWGETGMRYSAGCRGAGADGRDTGTGEAAIGVGAAAAAAAVAAAI